MFDSELPSEHSGGADLRSVRADSRISVEFAAAGDNTHVSRLYEVGSLRLRFPRGDRCEAVILNTGGGITGGDSLTVDVALGSDAKVVATSQAAEKLYRSDGPPASIDIRVKMESGARLSWLPQEAILFNGAKVSRAFDIEMPTSASLTLAEAVVFGRSAHGETLSSASWSDRWRIRRDGKLIFAENAVIGGTISEKLQRSAVGGGARAIATLIHVAPDAASRLDEARASLGSATSLSGCSAWNDMLVVRFAAIELHRLRADIGQVASVISGEAMPRSWSC